MKKTVLLRGLLGFPLGLALGYIITIVISLIAGDGEYLPCVPSLVDQMGGIMGAVVFQAVMCGVLGACFAAASTIWENERWSIAKQTGVYFFVVAVVMLPIAYLSHWMEHSLQGFLAYFVIFSAIFAFNWGIQYAFWKKRINRINAKMRQ